MAFWSEVLPLSGDRDIQCEAMGLGHCFFESHTHGSVVCGRTWEGMVCSVYIFLMHCVLSIISFEHKHSS